MRRPKWLPRGVTVVPLALAALLWGAASMGHDWRTASREPAGLAPDPATTHEAVVQVYAARAWGWRGIFGVHSWVAAKPTGAPQYTVYEVIGWRLYRGGTSLSISHRAPDARWFGAMPEVVAEIRGSGVDGAIERIDKEARTYPFAGEYTVWPGPNSNTLTAWLGRAAPELKLDLPPTAIGKDYLPGGTVLAEAPSGTGYQFSLWGAFGILVGKEEGLEINLLGLTFGVDPLGLAVKLPGVGRVGAT